MIEFIAEAITVNVILAGGWLFARALGLNGWVLPVLSYILGTAILVAVGFILIIFVLPTNPIVTLSLTIIIPSIFFLSSQYGNLDIHWRQLSISLIAIAVLVYVFRQANLVSWHTDSLRYVMTGAVIAGDEYRLISINLLSKRLLSVPLIHAPANLVDEFYLRSAVPLLAISIVGLFVWFCFKGLPSQLGQRRITLLTVGGVLLLVSNNRFVWHAFYLNGHLLFGALVLLIAGCGWLMATGARSLSSRPGALIAMQAVAVPALVVTRAEGFLVAAVAMLPTLLHKSIPSNHRILLLLVFAVSVTAWNLFASGNYIMHGKELPASVVGPLALGLIGLLGAPLLRLRLFEDNSARILVAVELLIWVALIAFTIKDPALLLTSVEATFQNVVIGFGSWGYSLVVIAAFVVLLTVLTRAADLVFLRFPVTTFVPLVFLLAYFREGAYRVGNGDSLNRMWMQIVPLAILFIVASIGSKPWRFAEPGMKIWQNKYAAVIPRRQ